MRLYPRSTQDGQFTGNVNHDLTEEQGSPSSLSAEGNNWDVVRNFVQQVDGTFDPASVPISILISSQGGSQEMRARLRQMDSTGAFTGLVTDPSPSFASSGIHTATLEFASGSWEDGDLLVLTIEGNHSGGGGRALDIGVNDENTYIDANFLADVATPGNLTVVAIDSESLQVDWDDVDASFTYNLERERWVGQGDPP